MTLTMLVLVSLAVYRGTLLVTGDRITRAPRRRLRAWLQERAHRLVVTEEFARCSCGWSVRRQGPGDGFDLVLVMTEPVPKGYAMPTSAMGHERSAHEVALAGRLHREQGSDESRLGYLLECPWCVSIYLGTIGAAVAWAWPAGWWRWPALAMAASGVTGLLATMAAPDENDHED